MVANLARLGISVYCYVSVRSQYLVRFLSWMFYKWSHSPPTYRRTVTPNRYWTHTVPEFDLQSSWITGACHYTRLNWVMMLIFCIWVGIHRNRKLIFFLSRFSFTYPSRISYPYHPIHRYIDISCTATAESSLLHIAISQTRTGNP